jgi:hypothetical protein
MSKKLRVAEALAVTLEISKFFPETVSQTSVAVTASVYQSP